MFRPLVSMILALAVSALAVSGAACANRPEGPPPVEPSVAEPSAAAGEPASAVASPEHAKPRRKPFEIHNSCPEITTLLFGDDPKNADAGRRAIAANSTIDGPRDENGKQTVWLLDSKGEPLVKVQVTKGMKHLEIGRSCRTLDAR